jgi:GNAT superfamily N-acetyltransferase
MIQRFDDCIYLHDADDNGVVRGSCLLGPHIEGVPNGDLFLFKLEVKPDHRRQGVATAIVRAAQQIARLRGDVAIYLEPKPYQDKPMGILHLTGWYRSIGFEWDMQDSRDNVMAWRPNT